MTTTTSAELGAEALRELRRTRRKNRLADVHWVDALYRVYLIVLVGTLAMFAAAGRLPADRLTTAEALDFAHDVTPWLGAAFALAFAIGLRSGGRGGPLVLEAPVVVHELEAPIDRALVLRGPAIKQLRFLAFSGAVIGAVIGEVASRRIEVNSLLAMACVGLAFALAASGAVGVAMVGSGRRIGWKTANAIALLTLAWSAADVFFDVRTSPLTFVAEIAFWPITFEPLAYIGVAFALVIPVIGVLGIRGISTEAALRRAGLVSQLRFAVTLQDVRTVVLLRRQLSQEKPRRTPYIKMKRGGRLPAVWRRDWQSILRFPATRLLRMAFLGVAAGVSVGLVWRGALPMLLVTGLALYIAAYDASEGIAQEVDHPSRWDSFPIEQGKLLTHHLPATALLMMIVILIGSATSLAFVPFEIVWRLTLSVLAISAAGCAVAAGIGAAQGAPNTAAIMGLGPELMGFVLAGRLILPPVIVVGTLAPLVLAGDDVNAINYANVSNAMLYPFIAVVGAFFYLRTRKPKPL